MIKVISLLFLIYTTAVFGQTSSFIQANVGLNRIGVLYDIGAGISKERHQLYGGLRFYGPDIVFEKEFPGILMNYMIAFNAEKKNKLNIGVAVSFFYENKLENTLILIDPKAIIHPNWNLTERVKFNLLAGIGPTINQVIGENEVLENNFTYLNYELAIGFSYKLSNSN